MKTINLFLLAIITVSLAACSFEESTFETVVGTGTIRGYVEAIRDYTADDIEYEPVSGAQIYITYNSKDLNTESSGKEVTKLVKGVVTGTDGTFSVEVSTIPDGVDYEVTVLELHDQQFTEFDDDAVEVNYDGYYPESSTKTVRVVEGGVKTVPKFQLDTPIKY